MKSSEIRHRFLAFFEARDHPIHPSASLIPADPTMLLTGAGMVPFKPIFMGRAQTDQHRAASVQKCVRTTDIELIGRTGRHLSFFEMLGNFSFGDYYKREAVKWAWELLTVEFKLDPERLWVTVFETDDEAADIWEREVGVEPERIVRLGADENFWSAGPTGPCGPSSEILYDQGPEAGCGRPECVVDCDCDRYLEIWNLVFMQYNRDERGELHPLPKKNIDTGMGLERIASILQNAPNNYATDLLMPLIERVCDLAGVVYGSADKTDLSLRVIADHARAMTFMVGDGILPGNDGRGYILRRLIRRAVRHGRLLGIETEFMASLVDVVVDLMGEHYVELRSSRDSIRTAATREEARFSKTLRQGLAILGEVIDEIKGAGGREVPAKTAFKLYDTYGFPLELTEEIAAEVDLTVDRPAFDALMSEQRERARAKAPEGHAELYVSNIYHQIKEQVGPTDFVGYETEAIEAKIVSILGDGHVKTEAFQGEEVEIFLDRTPFYAEKGGQVGDGGTIASSGGKIKVIGAAAPVADLVAHKGEVVEGRLAAGEAADAVVDNRRRRSISRNHTATHLLHWALRKVLGPELKQAGSLVDADRLRFDFNYHQALTGDELQAVERLVNDKILSAEPVRAFETTLDYAREAGALAFFGEKYGRFVRLVEIGDFSKELCGGVHVHNSSEVSYLKILSETGIGANTRRIEAVTGERFLRYVDEISGRLEAAAGLLKAPPDRMVQAVESLLARVEQQEAGLDKLKGERLAREVERIAARVESLDGISFFSGRLADADADALRTVADGLRAKGDRSAVALASDAGGKALVLIAVTQELVKDGFSAVSAVKQVGPIIRGGGGGRPELAQAGGKDATRFVEVFEAVKKLLEDLTAT
jgi:alanyl-tRNA synthetase